MCECKDNQEIRNIQLEVLLSNGEKNNVVVSKKEHNRLLMTLSNEDTCPFVRIGLHIFRKSSIQRIVAVRIIDKEDE